MTNQTDFSQKFTHHDYVAYGKRGAIASGSKPYTSSEIQYLTDNYGLISLKQIAIDLNRTYYSVVDKRKKLNLRYDINFFTKDEDAYLLQNARKLTQLQAANELGRTRQSIVQRAMRLGIRFIKVSDDSPKTKYPHEDIELIRALNDEGLTYTEIAEKFEIHKAYIRQLCIFEARLYDSTEIYHEMLQLQDDAIFGKN